MLTLIHPGQLVPREDHAGNTPWPPHIHLLWWTAHMQPTICRRHRSYGRRQWWTSRPHQQTRGQSNIIWNGSQHRNEQDHDQQHEQHQCSMNDQNLEEVTSFKYLSNPVQRWHLVSRSLFQDCLSNGSNGQTNQDLAVQHRQLWKQVQSVQVSCHLHPPLRL